MLLTNAVGYKKIKLKCFVHLIFECFKTSIKERASIVMRSGDERSLSHENTMRSGTLLSRSQLSNFS